MTSTYSKACQSFDLGIMGTSCRADAVVEIEILSAKDSSDWKLYPNGYNHQEIYRLVIECKIIQSNCTKLKDSVQLIFSLNSADYYDSLGNYTMSICGNMMHTGNEFNLQKGDKYVVFIKNYLSPDEGKKEWWLLRAEKMDYTEALTYYQVSRMINNYLQIKSSKQIDRDFLQKNKIFYSVEESQDGDVEAVIFYNPYSLKFALIKKGKIFESEPISFDYLVESFKSDEKYFMIRDVDNWIKLNRKNLHKKE
ncbi:MAG: hypothetical protein JW801_05000 [Bacteroidales bacterium]|nr:hypothetical protein [Bacteroidales bacterium]